MRPPAHAQHEPAGQGGDQSRFAEALGLVPGLQVVDIVFRAVHHLQDALLIDERLRLLPRAENHRLVLIAAGESGDHQGGKEQRDEGSL